MTNGVLHMHILIEIDPLFGKNPIIPDIVLKVLIHDIIGKIS